MEKLDLKLLSKETTKAFKNALKLCYKDHELYPQIAGVGFIYDEEINVKYLMGSNGKVAISFRVDFPDEFNNKVLDKEGNVISTNYPKISLPNEFTKTIELNVEELKSLYEQATKEVKELKLTASKLKKQRQKIGVPIADNFEVDYFSFKELLKAIEMVGNANIHLNEDNYNYIFFKPDKSVVGVVHNQYLGFANTIKEYKEYNGIDDVDNS